MWCTYCHDLSCCVLRSLWCMLMGSSYCCHTCLHWDSYYAMLVGCLSHMNLCHTDRSPFLIESSCNWTSLESIPPWGHFPCMIVKSSLCISSLLETLNAAAYTILTLGPRDVVRLVQTLLSMTYVLMLLMIVMFLFFMTCGCIHLCSF